MLVAFQRVNGTFVVPRPKAFDYWMPDGWEELSADSILPETPLSGHEYVRTQESVCDSMGEDRNPEVS